MNPELKESIQDFVNDHFSKYCRTFIRGVRNLIFWFPVIWRDRQWDDCFLWKMLESKLTRMEKYFREQGLSVNSEKDARNIQICKCLCRRLREADYTTPYDERSKPHFEWFSKQLFGGAKRIVNEETGFTRLVFDRETEPDSRWIREAFKHQEYLAAQDLELLTRIIKKQSGCWWD